MKKIVKIVKRIDFEALIWISAFTYLTFINPYTPKHLDFCLFRIIGIENCPGCGLGKSISMIFHGDFTASFAAHPLGLPAIILITKRIYQLIKSKLYLTKKMEVYNG